VRMRKCPNRATMLAIGMVTRLLTDLLLVQLLVRFRDTAVNGLLGKAPQDASALDEHRKVARRLCQWSREIRFQLGPPEDSPQKAVEGIAALFEYAADAILLPVRRRRCALKEQLELYAGNIRERAKLIRKAAAKRRPARRV